MFTLVFQFFKKNHLFFYNIYYIKIKSTLLPTISYKSFFSRNNSFYTVAKSIMAFFPIQAQDVRKNYLNWKLTAKILPFCQTTSEVFKATLATSTSFRNDNKICFRKCVFQEYFQRVVTVKHFWELVFFNTIYFLFRRVYIFFVCVLSMAVESKELWK